MTEERREFCGKCDEHILLEEYVKTIPELLTFANRAKGIGIVAAIITVCFIGAMLGMVESSKSEVSQKQAAHEQLIKEQQEKMSCQVEAIRADVAEIKTSVAVMVKTFDLVVSEAAKEREDARKRIDALEKSPNVRRYNPE